MAELRLPVAHRERGAGTRYRSRFRREQARLLNRSGF